jgi:hypothetical protein
MDKNNPLPKINIKYTIAKKDIPEFVNSLHEIQEKYLESAVELSGYKDARVELERIMKL